MRDDFVARFHSVGALKQEMEDTFGKTDGNKEIKDLKANLILALVKLSEARGEELPDRVRKPQRRPRTRNRIYSI